MEVVRDEILYSRLHSGSKQICICISVSCGKHSCSALTSLADSFQRYLVSFTSLIPGQGMSGRGHCSLQPAGTDHLNSGNKQQNFFRSRSITDEKIGETILLVLFILQKKKTIIARKDEEVLKGVSR